MEIRNLQSLLVCSIFFEESHPLKMTESLADGPDWYLRSRFCSGLSLFSTVDEWSGSQLSSPMDSILEDKELMKMHVDLQKRFPIYHVCPKCLAALLCGAAIRMNASTSLQVSDEVGMTLVDW